MEERLSAQPNEQAEGPAATTTKTTEASTSPPRAASDGNDAPALFCTDDEEEDEDFEFPSVSRDSPAGTAAPADELFADGRIRPLHCHAYPVFGHGGFFVGHSDRATRSDPIAAAPPRVRGQLGRLFLEESRARSSSTSSTTSSTSSSDGGGGALEDAPPESYCVWTPGSSTAPRKSGSTGSLARWRRISELVVGRSRSDGKERFAFAFFPVAPQPTKPKETATINKRHDNKPPKANKPSPAPAGVRKPAAPLPAVADAVTGLAAPAHRTAYGGGGTTGGSTPRRTFLPYREELVGFFANVNGISRSHQQQYPF